MDFQQESTIKNLLPDWPEGYRAISARVLPGISSEYPCVAWSLHDDCTFLIPCSIFCAESNYRLSKSHRSKSFFVISLTAFFRFDSHGGPSVGFYCRFIVKVDPFDKRDFTVKAFQMGIKDCSNLPTNTHLFKVNCTISDEFPPRCYSKELGNIFLPHRVLNATPIPNVVYEAFVECKIFVKNDDGSRISASTEVEVRPELARIIRVKPLQSRFNVRQNNGFVLWDGTMFFGGMIYCIFRYSEHVDILRSCPWNIRKVQSGEIVPQIVYWNYSDDATSQKFPLQDKPIKIKPPFPTRALSKVRLWYFENNRVVRARFPRTLVKITVGMEKMVWESLTSDVRLYYPPLEEGQFFFGWIIYNEFISCYYVQNYLLPKEGESLQNKLEKRIVIENGNPLNEYFVRIRESTSYKDFYVTESFENILIADSKLILRNISLDDHRLQGCPVWIRLEPEHDRLAHFSISELNRSLGEFTASEKMMSYPNISGIGILIDLETNAVFSENHPQKRIVLANSDKYEIKIGNFFYFSAAYWHSRKIYLIGAYQLISTNRRVPVNTFYLENKFLFEDHFCCYIFQTKDTHMSKNFGPISDSMGLITNKAKKDKVDWPSKGQGFVCFNPDWKVGISSQLILYSLDLDKEAQCVTSSCLKQVGLKWWQHQHKDVNGLCRCDDIWHLLYSMKGKDNEVFNEEIKESLKNTLNEYQKKISLI